MPPTQQRNKDGFYVKMRRSHHLDKQIEPPRVLTGSWETESTENE